MWNRLVSSAALAAFALSLSPAARADEPRSPGAGEAARTDLDGDSDGPPSGVRTTVHSNDPRALVQQKTGNVELTLMGDDGLEQGTGEIWTTVCSAPCRRALDPRGTFRVAGDGITPSDDFQLAERDAVDLDVHAGSQARRSGGWIATAGGAALAVGGAAMLLGSSLMAPPTTGPFAQPFFAAQNVQQARTAATLQTAGLVGLVLGGASLLLGIALVGTSGTTVTAVSP